ncbi:hypothetical protein D3C81_1477740 [compost metagenome]
MHTNGARFDRHAGLPGIATHVEAGTGYRDRTGTGLHHKRPRRVVLDTEHDLTLLQLDGAFLCLEAYVDAGTAIELQRRTVGQDHLLALAKRRLETGLIVVVALLPEHQPQAHGAHHETRGHGITAP